MKRETWELELLGKIAPDKCEIWIVDGNLVRLRKDKGGLGCANFSLGGHHYIYPEIAENKLYVERAKPETLTDTVNNLWHEVLERTRMKFMKQDYEPAHVICLSVESAIRTVKKKPENMNMKEYKKEREGA